MKFFKPIQYLDFKRNYFIHFEASLIVSLATFITLFKIALPAQDTDDHAIYIPKQGVLQLEAFLGTVQHDNLLAAPKVVSVPEPPPVDYIFEEDLHDLNIEMLTYAPLPYPKEEPPINNIVHSHGPDMATYPTKTMAQLIDGYAGLQRRITYPPRAVRDKIEGRVVIQYLIDERGKVRNLKIIQGLRYDVNQAAVHALRNSRFHPVRIDGKPVPVEQVIHILFRIEYPSSR
ncbi:MAG: energy transducer TonB [Fodinibius sp.]|nr:energy transducer TonB [Fodinibius sp.]